MENQLKGINAVLGVIGSFVCLSDGSIAAKAMTDKFDAASLETAAHVATQTMNALEISGQHIADIDLVFSHGRLILKNLRGAILAIVCERNVNLPLLKLTANLAAKNLAAEIKPPKPRPSAPPRPAVSAPVESASQLSAVPEAALPTSVAELEEETRRLIDEGKRHQLHLRVMNVIAVWLACPNHHALLTPPEARQIELGGLASEGKSIELLFKQLGFESNQWANTLYGNQRLNFSDPMRELIIEVCLDRYEMYHRLELAPFLAQEEITLSVTALVLTRLQMVEMNNNLLGELCALILEHDLSVGPQIGKIDASYIMHLCAEDWGWFKTVSMNLDRLTTFAATNLSPSDRGIVAERIQRLRQSIDTAPKSLRWQTRARLGETIKWYDTPQEF